MSSDPGSRHARDAGRAGINPTVNYEPEDVNPNSIFKFLVWLVLAVLVSMSVVLLVYRALVAREPTSATPPSPLRAGRRILPPEPRLQGAPGHETNPQNELRQSQAEAEAVLSSSAWVDEKAGIARIPIEEAMRLVAQRGLPAQARGAKKEIEKRP